MSASDELVSAVLATLSADASIRGGAEAALSARRDTPGFMPALLSLAVSPTADAGARQAAAVYLKNCATRFYARADWRDAALAGDRAALKGQLAGAMLGVPVPVRRQLSSVLAVVAEHEYPRDWPELVPALGGRLGGLVEKGAACEWVVLQGVLETLHAVFERYPWRERSDELYTEINYSLEHAQRPVLAALQMVCGVLGDAAAMGGADEKMARLVVGNAELVVKVFFCLSWQELPPFFEENMQLFMAELRKLLTYANPRIDAAAAAAGDEAEPTCVDNLVVSVLDTLDLYQSKHDEEFRPFLQAFVQCSWELLMNRSNAPKNDSVVTSGIKFLTTVARSPDYALFSSQETLQQVCRAIVVPNIELREDDTELFEDNPVEYIRRDIEGSDAGTRRRGAVELVKGLCVHFERPVTQALTTYVSDMLAAGSDWKRKDTALFIVTALGWKSGTQAGGVTETSSLINVLDFFQTHVLPELKAHAANPAALAVPIYTSDLIKYVISFRNQIPKESYHEVILLCMKFLGASEPVVQTYATACIERLLSVKDAVPVPAAGANGNANGNGVAAAAAAAAAVAAAVAAAAPAGKSRVLRMSKDDVKPILPTLTTAVIGALKTSRRANEYLMRLLLRVVTCAKDEILPYVESVLGVTLEVLNVVIKNPANPLFNHYLFEVISALIRFAGNRSNVETFEGVLMTPLHSILTQDVTEFGSYVFQILSQLMGLRDSALPQKYTDIIPPLLDPAMWERRGYIRGMVQFLETYLVKNSAAVETLGQLSPVLGVFHKLVASKATDHLGIQLVCTILETFPLTTLNGDYMNGIVSVLIRRLQAAKTPKYTQNLLYCLSVIVLRFGTKVLERAMNSLQPNLLAMFLDQVWIRELPSIIRPHDRRICALAMADLSCATDLCHTPPYTPLWPAMLTATVAVTEHIQTGTSGDVSDNEDDAPIESGDAYSAGYSQLRWASAGRAGTGTGRPVVAPGVDPRAHLADRVAAYAAHQPAAARAALDRLDPPAAAALNAYLHAAGKQIPA